MHSVFYQFEILVLCKPHRSNSYMQMEVIYHLQSHYNFLNILGIDLSIIYCFNARLILIPHVLGVVTHFYLYRP